MKIIIDTDPSPDDALAILMALAAPDKIELCAITTVGGNVPLTFTTKNALKTLELIGRTDIPVYPGAPGPFCGPLVTAEHVHGTTGFDGYELPEPTTKPADGYAPDKIVEILMAEPDHSVTLCCLAPLTNIALALTREPRIVSKIDRIVMMGGARTEAGNIAPCAEYNLYVDPEAAQKVVHCGRPIVMIPLDCTHKAFTTAVRMQKWKDIGSPVSEAFYHMIKFNKTFNEKQMGTDGGPLHDPTVLTYVLEPSVFSGKMVNVEVECRGEFTRGCSVVDWWDMTKRPKNVLYITEVDADRYFELVRQAIAYF